jgi:hypothetical protein
MGNTGELRALLLTKEESTVASFTSICSELSIKACAGPPFPEVVAHLDEQKYAAVVVDFDTPEAAESYLPALKQSRFNKNAVVVAVAANARNLEKALACRAHFVLKRPVQDAEIRRTLRAAYDFMLVDRRSYFRCARILPIRLRLLRSGSRFECSTINVSSNGVAIYSSMRLRSAEPVDLELVLPDGFVVLASGIVVWDDGSGKSGLNFQCRTPEIRQRLDAWLTEQAAAAAKQELMCRDFSHIITPAAAESVIAGEGTS